MAPPAYFGTICLLWQAHVVLSDRVAYVWGHADAAVLVAALAAAGKPATLLSVASAGLVSTAEAGVAEAGRETTDSETVGLTEASQPFSTLTLCFGVITDCFALPYR